MKTNTIALRRQNFMLAVRQELGWPSFKPTNDAIAFCSGYPVDFEVGTELARMAQILGKDVVYSGWSLNSATEPRLAIAYREMLAIDVVDDVVPFAASNSEPIVLVGTRGRETFAIDRRGSLARAAGVPKNIAKGRQLALKRIYAAAAKMSDVWHDNQIFEPGADNRFERCSARPAKPGHDIVGFQNAFGVWRRNRRILTVADLGGLVG